MRLINTKTLELSEFYDSEIPRYGILSHTWGKEEVSYQEWCEKKFSKKKAAYNKICKFCEICRQDGYYWAWVDTCCIDKTSSAELSEAINSMYRWYWGEACYAYMVDVPSTENFDINAEDSTFRKSRWFTRGWTLQELVAPGAVSFFSSDWVKIGQRGANAQAVASITGIPETVLKHPFNLNQYSVAQKMSWAASRKTTRTEDIAYCLMGFFDVNMPLLYGEGDKAFLRLQEEIMKISSDHTLFAWASTAEYSKGTSCGLLAPAPHYFAGSRLFIRREPDHKSMKTIKTYSMTNHGLEIELPLTEPRGSDGARFALLNCYSKDDPTKYIAVHLTSALYSNKVLSTRAMKYEGDYERIECDKLEFLKLSTVKSSLQKIYVRRGGTSFNPSYRKKE